MANLRDMTPFTIGFRRRTREASIATAACRHVAIAARTSLPLMIIFVPTGTAGSAAPSFLSAILFIVHQTVAHERQLDNAKVALFCERTQPEPLAQAL
jgi:hypothetical protein